MNKSLKETVLHPATVAGSVLGGFASLLWLPLDPSVLTALLATVWSHAGTLFTAGSTLSVFTRYGMFDAPWLQPIAFGLLGAGGVLYVAKLLDRFVDDFQDRL